MSYECSHAIPFLVAIGLVFGCGKADETATPAMATTSTCNQRSLDGCSGGCAPVVGRGTDGKELFVGCIPASRDCPTAEACGVANGLGCIRFSTLCMPDDVAVTSCESLACAPRAADACAGKLEDACKDPCYAVIAHEFTLDGDTKKGFVGCMSGALDCEGAETCARRSGVEPSASCFWFSNGCVPDGYDRIPCTSSCKPESN